ncbi:MAG: hypothetical protein KY475_27775, partial [Planctomycetes bacterium]|nr:hypothetical protein [Planctomycetota bacterium]
QRRESLRLREFEGDGSGGDGERTLRRGRAVRRNARSFWQLALRLLHRDCHPFPAGGRAIDRRSRAALFADRAVQQRFDRDGL